LNKRGVGGLERVEKSSNICPSEVGKMNPEIWVADAAPDAMVALHC